MILASTDNFRAEETMRRVEQGRQHLDCNTDTVETMPDGLVLITFGAFLTIYVQGDKFWQGASTAPPGRAWPRLAAYHRAFLFLQTIRVVEQISTASVSTLRVKPALPYFVTGQPKEFPYLPTKGMSVGEELRSAQDLNLSGLARSFLNSAAVNLGYKDLLDACINRARIDVLSEAIEAAEADPL